jgi:hypothetical protein
MFLGLLAMSVLAYVHAAGYQPSEVRPKRVMFVRYYVQTTPQMQMQIL